MKRLRPVEIAANLQDYVASDGTDTPVPIIRGNLCFMGGIGPRQPDWMFQDDDVVDDFQLMPVRALALCKQTLEFKVDKRMKVQNMDGTNKKSGRSAPEMPASIPQTLYVKELPHVVSLPKRANPLDAGLDLYAAVGEPEFLEPGQWKAIPTGICVRLPDNTVGFITPRSGLALKSGISVINSPGTIDGGFAGELKVLLHNQSETTFAVTRGDRVAQLVVLPVILTTPVKVDELPKTERGEGGFGSSGLR